MKRFKKFIFNTSVLVLTSLIFRAIDIWFISYITKKIGAELVGVYQLIMTVYLFGITLATSGINLSVTRVVSEELAKDNLGGIKKVMLRCLYITLITSIFTSIIFITNSDLICTKWLGGKVSREIIYLFSLALPMISMSSAIAGYFAGVRRIYKNAVGQSIEHIAKVAITAFLLSLYLPKGLDYACFALILGDLISEIISFVYIYIIFKFDIKKYGSKFKEFTHSSYTKKIIRISIPVAITSYIRSGLSTLKHLIVPSSLEKSGINSSTSLANYGIIHGMALPVIMFPDILVKSFASLLIPEFARYRTKGDYKRTKQMTSILLFAISSASAILSFLLYSFSDFLGTILYAGTNVAYYIRILSPLATLIYVDTVVDSVLRGLDAQVGVMVVNILDLAISTSFIYFAVPKLGVFGYIISIYISEILNFSMSLFQLLKIVYWDNKKLDSF